MDIIVRSASPNVGELRKKMALLFFSGAILQSLIRDNKGKKHTGCSFSLYI